LEAAAPKSLVFWPANWRRDSVTWEFQDRGSTQGLHPFLSGATRTLGEWATSAGFPTVSGTGRLVAIARCTTAACSRVEIPALRAPCAAVASARSRAVTTMSTREASVTVTISASYGGVRSSSILRCGPKGCCARWRAVTDPVTQKDSAEPTTSVFWPAAIRRNTSLSDRPTERGRFHTTGIAICLCPGNSDASLAELHGLPSIVS